MIAFFVSLPEPLQLAIGLGVAFLLDFLLLQVTNFLPWLGAFLGQYRDSVVAAVSTALVALVGQWLGMIPPAYEQIANILLQLVVAALALFGLPLMIIKFARMKQWRGFRK